MFIENNYRDSLAKVSFKSILFFTLSLPQQLFRALNYLKRIRPAGSRPIALQHKVKDKSVPSSDGCGIW